MAKLSAAELAKREDVIQKMKKNKRSLVKRYGPDAEKVMYGRATNIAKKVAETQMEKSNLKELVRAALMQEKAGFSKEFDNDPALKGGQKNLPDGLQKAIISKAKPSLDETDPSNLFKDFGNATYMGKVDPTTQKLNSVVSQMLDAFPALMNQIQVISPDIFKKDKKSLNYANALARSIRELNILLKDLKQSSIKEGPEDRDWATYVKSLVNDIRINGLGDYTTFSEDDFIADYEEYIGGKMDIDEDLDLGHEDNEPHMIKAELYRVGKYAMELYGMVEEFEEMGGEVDFPAWWQAKITTAMNNMVSAKHYLDFEVKEPAIDAAVDALTGEDIIPNTPSEPLEDEIEEGLPKGFWKKETAELDESFEKLVGKLKKQGKSEKAAKAIAGAVASYKAKGGGKGPTAKQKARVDEKSEPLYLIKMDEYTPGFDEIKDSVFYKYKVVYYKDKEGKQPFAQTIFQYEPTYDKIFAAMNSSNYFDKKDVQLYKAFDVNGKEYPIAGDPGDISLSTLRAAGFRDKPELTWQAGE